MTTLFEDKLLKRKTAGNLRKLLDRCNLIDFSSNDYLGLARSQALTQAVFTEWGILPQHLGSTGSRLLTGNSVYAEQLEQRIASFHGYESGLLFSCGYMANLGLISSISSEDSILLFDAQVHASVRDGIRLSRAQSSPFRHNDLEHLTSRLEKTNRKGDKFIVVESIYSTDGSTAPLREICTLAKKYDAVVIVDEAHAVGVCGPQGRGLVAEYNLVD